VTVVVDGSSLQADSEPKPVGFVWGWCPPGAQFAFIIWTVWTFVVATAMITEHCTTGMDTRTLDIAFEVLNVENFFKNAQTIREKAW